MGKAQELETLSAAELAKQKFDDRKIAKQCAQQLYELPAVLVRNSETAREKGGSYYCRVYSGLLETVMLLLDQIARGERLNGPKTFYDWVQETYSGQDNEFGDLAHDMTRDVEFFYKIKDLKDDAELKAIDIHIAGTGAYSTWRKCRKTYVQYCSQFKGIEERL